MSEIIHGDCVAELAKLDENSVDAIVTDPPYGLKFMGKEFDDLGEGAQQREWHKAWAQEALRVLKPGGHLIAFGGTRTYHHLATAVEEAGFEIRDQIQWLYGSGFPKSLNVGKAIDKKRYDLDEIYQVTAWIREARDKAGVKNSEIDKAFNANTMARHWTDVPPNGKQPSVPTLDQVPKLLEVLGVKPEEVPEDIARLLLDLNGKKGQPGENWFKREVVGKNKQGKLAVAPGQGEDRSQVELDITAPATEEAARWEGWGTALKPANEPCVLARKPFKGTVAENVQEWGTGALNIDGCRVGTEGGTKRSTNPKNLGRRESGDFTRGNFGVTDLQEGRWPANVILDEEAGELLDEQSGNAGGTGPNKPWHPGGKTFGGSKMGKEVIGKWYSDQGGASRFFYCPKAGKNERNAGLEDFEERKGKRTQAGGDDTKGRPIPRNRNIHPTVKPVKLMAYLIRLITPPGGTVLDPFLGSGSTGCAAALEGVDFIGIELDPEYIEIARARIKHWEEEAKS